MVKFLKFCSLECLFYYFFLIGKYRACMRPVRAGEL